MEAPGSVYKTTWLPVGLFLLRKVADCQSRWIRGLDKMREDLVAGVETGEQSVHSHLKVRM